MKYKIGNQLYDVVIEKKNNKNLYIKVKEDLKIYITCNYFTTKKQIVDVLNKNVDTIIKMIEKQIRNIEKSNQFLYLGNKYDIIIVPVIDNIDVDDDNFIIYAKDKKQLDKWYRQKIFEIFTERFYHCFHIFNEGVTIPKLKIRAMKSRWGVYNRKNHSVTLNAHLIEFDIEKLDYVIFHELSHIIHFNHSREFWQLVSKYCPNYKNIRNEMKE